MSDMELAHRLAGALSNLLASKQNGATWTASAKASAWRQADRALAAYHADYPTADSVLAARERGADSNEDGEDSE